MEEQDKAMRSQSLAIARCYCVIVVVIPPAYEVLGGI